MRYRQSLRVRAPLANVPRRHISATSLKDITPPPVLMQLHHAPERTRGGDERAFTMRIGPLPPHWKARVEDVSPSVLLDQQIGDPCEARAHGHSFSAVDMESGEMMDEVAARLKPHAACAPAGLGRWRGLPLLLAYRGWRARRFLEGVAA